MVEMPIEARYKCANRSVAHDEYYFAVKELVICGYPDLTVGSDLHHFTVGLHVALCTMYEKDKCCRWHLQYKISPAFKF